MKKILALLLAVSLSLFCLAALASCGGDEGEQPKDDGKTEQQADNAGGNSDGETLESDLTVYFTFRAVRSSYVVSGLTEKGKAAQTLVLPYEYEGGEVIGIDAGAFAGGAVRQVVIPYGSKVSVLFASTDGSTGCFDGAENLTRVDFYLTEEELYVINPCPFNVPAGFTVHFLEGVSRASFYNEWPDGISYVSDLKAEDSPVKPAV